MKEIYFNSDKKNLKVNVRKCGYFNPGLMFRTKNTSPCLFEFKKPVKFKITSLFVFFDFIAVWMDKNNKIIEIKKIKPFTWSRTAKKSFFKILEIPVSLKYKRALKLLVGDRKDLNIEFN